MSRPSPTTTNRSYRGISGTRASAELADFYDATIDAQLPEATRLARTIETWWPAILVALTQDVTNARTERFNRIIKQVKRVACGIPEHDQLQRRILSHIAVTRPQISSVSGSHPAQFVVGRVR